MLKQTLLDRQIKHIIPAYTYSVRYYFTVLRLLLFSNKNYGLYHHLLQSLNRHFRITHVLSGMK